MLWTGGLDSTYVVAVLSRKENVTICPYYMIDNYRSSVPNELKAINEITLRLKKDNKTKAIIQEIKIINSNEIKIDSTISRSYLSLRRRHKLGSQYDYLARYAKQHNIRFAVGLQVGERSKVSDVFKSEGRLKKEEDDICSFFVVDDDNSSEDVINVFSHFEIPSFVYKHTKLDEVEGLKQLGLEDVMLMTWFCHSPICGLPCGQCSPCKDALNEGLSWRVPLKGRILGYLVKPYRIFVKACHKFMMLRTIKGIDNI